MTSILSSFPALYSAAPRLTIRFFTCPHRIHHSISPARLHIPRTALRPFRSARYYKTTRAGLNPGGLAGVSSPLSSLSRTISANQVPALESQGKYIFPEVSHKAVAYWLLASAASVFGIVVFGGLTRLTESGLSITEWKPVTGSFPPTNHADWNSEFAKYRASPEFKLLNPSMGLSEFKSIYYMEWAHRLWGRIVGISFVVPAIYFVARRKLSAPMAAKVVGIACLIGIQGGLGWWMVKSGLKDDLFAPGSHPRVSQYRLVAHLGTAFICYTAMLWNGLSILRAHKLLADPVEAKDILTVLKRPELRIFRRSVGALAVLIFLTAMSGGLVAGLDAGLIYNEFPYMGSGLTPPKSELFSDFYSHTPDKSDIWWRNALENPSLVQLDHRVLATTTFTSIIALWAYTKLSPIVKQVLPAASRKGIHGLVGFACLQLTLGISTLIYMVPVSLASAHQAGSLALLSYAIILGSRTWVPRRTSRLVAQKLKLMGKHPAPKGPDIRRSAMEGRFQTSIPTRSITVADPRPGVAALREVKVETL